MMHYATCRDPCWEFDLISSCVPSGDSMAETVNICIFPPLTLLLVSDDWTRVIKLPTEYTNNDAVCTRPIHPAL